MGPAVFSLGLAAGALISASVLWLSSGIGTLVPDPLAATIVLVAATLAVARDYGVLRVALPENRRLVPQSVLRTSTSRAALRFGVEMGSGVRTFMPASAPYVVALALVLLEPSALEAVAAAFGFAAGRALVPWARLLAGDGDVWDNRLTTSTRLMIRWSALMMIPTTVMLVGFAT